MGHTHVLLSPTCAMLLGPAPRWEWCLLGHGAVGVMPVGHQAFGYGVSLAAVSYECCVSGYCVSLAFGILLSWVLCLWILSFWIVCFLGYGVS